MMESGHPIIIFDGICNLCNRSVDWIIRHDPDAQFRFVSLQDPRSGQLLPDKESFDITPDSVILIWEGNIFTQSTAALEIVRRLPGSIRHLYRLIYIPRLLRDWVYRFIARHRYRWFGKRDQCRLPNEQDQSRFL